MTDKSEFNLGQSSSVLQYTDQEIQEADIQLNRLLVKSAAYTTVGALNGALLSIFFKHKVAVIAYSTGIGLGLALHQYGNGLFDNVRRKI